MKDETIQIDAAGRLVLPKPVREQFNLLPGDRLRLSVEGHTIKLEPTDASGTLVRKGNLMVFSGEFSAPVTTDLVADLLEQEREGRLNNAGGKTRRK